MSLFKFLGWAIYSKNFINDNGPWFDSDIKQSNKK